MTSAGDMMGNEEGQARMTWTSRPSFVRILRIVALLLMWYCTSTTIILLQKGIYSGTAPAEDPSNSDTTSPADKASAPLFPFPLTVTMMSSIIVSFWAIVFTRFERFRAQPITRKQFLSYVLPIGVTTAAEIGFSNTALKMLKVSIATILKGSGPVFTMAWGIVFGVETFSIPLTLAVFVITGGISLACVGEGAEFNLIGMIFQMCATGLGGFRWAMTHVLLQGSPESRMSPLTATLYTSPTMAIAMMPVALSIEGTRLFEHFSSASSDDNIRVATLLFVVASLVFVLLICEYTLVCETSSLALSIAGVFKEAMTIGGGMLTFHEHLSLLNVIGFIVCQVGIAAYIRLRYDPSSDQYEHTPLATHDDLTESAFQLDDDEAPGSSHVHSQSGLVVLQR